MSNLKEIYIKGMNAIMLDCDRAALYATKNDFKSLGCIKRMQLKMHLSGCEFCRTFVEQSKIITSQINEMKEIDGDNLKIHLTENQKEHLRETVESNLKEN